MDDFYHNDFEELIREKADQYKMYPSDKVWKGIDRSLRKRRRWYWTGFAFLLSGLGYFTATEFMKPKPLDAISPAKAQPSPAPEQTQSALPFGPVFNSQAAEQVAEPSSMVAVVIPMNRHTGILPSVPLSGSGIAGEPADGDDQPLVGVDQPLDGVDPLSVYPSPVDPLSATERAEAGDPRHDVWAPVELSGATAVPAVDNNMSGEPTLPLAIMVAPRSVSVESTKLNPPDALTSMDSRQESNSDRQRINWLHDVIAKIPASNRSVGWQLAFSPTVNYRKLTGGRGNKIAGAATNIPVARMVEGDVNNLVNHHPALGFELGNHAFLRITKRVKVKAGLQFNYSKYDIQAYSAPPELATIALNASTGVDLRSITNYTNIRNFGGSSVEDLKNQYFQLSVPVGLELAVFGSEALQLSVAGTIQPTYMLNRNTYLITTDYKNYTKEPTLVRRWNLNAGAEAFLSYRKGGVRWQVGPQFRYQLLSTYRKVYPIREYLMEYGFKVGVTKTIR